HKYLYRSIEQEIPDEYYTIPFGKAAVVREGTNISVITYGLGVHWALKLANEHPELDMEIIDLRTLLPLDKETIFRSVKKTGKVIVLNEDTLTGSISAEIAALISEYCFEYLDAPVMREGALDTPVPMNKELEENFLPEKRFREKVFLLHQY
ncbi:MAG: dehydrogenase, partial [Bacteroidetes bacterium]